MALIAWAMVKICCLRSILTSESGLDNRWAMASIRLQCGHRTGVSASRVCIGFGERETAAESKHRAKGKSSKLHKVLAYLVFVLVTLFAGLNAFPSSYVLRNWGLSIDYRAHAHLPPIIAWRLNGIPFTSDVRDGRNSAPLFTEPK